MLLKIIAPINKKNLKILVKFKVKCNIMEIFNKIVKFKFKKREYLRITVRIKVFFKIKV